MQNEKSHGQKFKNRLTLATSGDFVDTSYLGRDSIFPAAKIFKKNFLKICIYMYVNKEKYEKITPKQRTRRMAFDSNCFISVWKQVTKTLSSFYQSLHMKKKKLITSLVS